MGKLNEMWSRTAGVTINEVHECMSRQVIVAVLEDEIEIHKSRLQLLLDNQPAGSGTIHTTISGIEQRIKELKQ